MHKSEAFQMPQPTCVTGSSGICELHGQVIRKQNIMSKGNGADELAKSLGISLGLILLLWRHYFQREKPAMTCAVLRKGEL